MAGFESVLELSANVADEGVEWCGRTWMMSHVS